MDAARLNLFWFLSLLVPAAIMFGATYFQRRWVLVLGIVFSLSATYVLCNVAAQKKWDIRIENAKTDQELEAATADGANIVFTAFLFAPLESVTYTWLWSVVGHRTWRKIKDKGAFSET